jgi:hypothetical protein
MLKAKDGDFFVTDWLRNRNTLEYLGIWEQIYNPVFNYGEFAIIKSKAGLNNYRICQRSGHAEYGPFRDNSQAVARGQSQPERQYPGLRNHQRADLPVEHGKYQRSFYKRANATIRTVAKAQPDSNSANAGVAGC